MKDVHKRRIGKQFTMIWVEILLTLAQPHVQENIMKSERTKLKFN